MSDLTDQKIRDLLTRAVAEAPEAPTVDQIVDRMSDPLTAVPLGDEPNRRGLRQRPALIAAAVVVVAGLVGATVWALGADDADRELALAAEPLPVYFVPGGDDAVIRWISDTTGRELSGLPTSGVQPLDQEGAVYRSDGAAIRVVHDRTVWDAGSPMLWMQGEAMGFDEQFEIRGLPVGRKVLAGDDAPVAAERSVTYWITDGEVAATADFYGLSVDEARSLLEQMADGRDGNLLSAPEDGFERTETFTSPQQSSRRAVMVSASSADQDHDVSTIAAPPGARSVLGAAWWGPGVLKRWNDREVLVLPTFGQVMFLDPRGVLVQVHLRLPEGEGWNGDEELSQEQLALLESAMDDLVEVDHDGWLALRADLNQELAALPETASQVLDPPSGSNVGSLEPESGWATVELSLHGDTLGEEGRSGICLEVDGDTGCMPVIAGDEFEHSGAVTTFQAIVDGDWWYAGLVTADPAAPMVPEDVEVTARPDLGSAEIRTAPVSIEGREAWWVAVRLPADASWAEITIDGGGGLQVRPAT